MCTCTETALYHIIIQRSYLRCCRPKIKRKLSLCYYSEVFGPIQQAYATICIWCSISCVVFMLCNNAPFRTLFTLYTSICKYIYIYTHHTIDPCHPTFFSKTAQAFSQFFALKLMYTLKFMSFSLCTGVLTLYNLFAYIHNMFNKKNIDLYMK